MSNRTPLTRRSMLGLAGGLLGISQAPFFSRAEAAPTAPTADGSFSFAHLTDIHVTPKLRAPEGLRLCVQAVNALPQSTAFVLTGGDLIMDALEEEPSYVREQWACFDDAMGALRLPAHHTIGNHDIGGWSHKARIDKSAPEYGKAYFAEKYGKGSTYRSFDHGGWHFIILDSVALDEASGDYYGWIDDAQIEWLKADLAKTGKQTPIIVSTHIPLSPSGASSTQTPAGAKAQRDSSTTATLSGKCWAVLTSNSSYAVTATFRNASSFPTTTGPPSSKGGLCAGCGGRARLRATPRASAW
jgi:hypothetical protein